MEISKICRCVEIQATWFIEVGDDDAPAGQQENENKRDYKYHCLLNLKLTNTKNTMNNANSLPLFSPIDSNSVDHGWILVIIIILAMIVFFVYLWHLGRQSIPVFRSWAEERGVNIQIRNQLRQLIYGSTDINYEQRECVFCLSEFQAEDRIYVLQCNHVFHLQCLNAYMNRMRTCPVCRLPISIPSTEQRELVDRIA